MNTQIIKKCIDELSAASPRMEYVLGMLEALYAMHADGPAIPTHFNRPVDTTTNKVPAFPGNATKDEETLAMEAMGARGKSVIDELKKTGQLQ